MGNLYSNLFIFIESSDLISCKKKNVGTNQNVFKMIH